MINLRKYIKGFKPKDKEELLLETHALDKCEEDLIVLLIPRSELDKILVEVSNEQEG